MIQFNYTLYKKFWKCISESNKTETIHGMLHVCKEKELITIDEYHEIFFAPFDNLACKYAIDSLNKYCQTKEELKFEYPHNGISFCEFCPFDITNSYNKCLDGLYHKWAVLCYSTGESKLEEYRELAKQILEFKIKDNINYV